VAATIEPASPAAKSGNFWMTAEIAGKQRYERDHVRMGCTQTERAKRVPQSKTIRRAARLTQVQFAARYQIPVRTLRDWKHGTSEPDQAARSYLRAIAGDPVAVERALERPAPRSG
jgi:putative transcriptional regulator